ncbi:glycosyltransferase [bacterium]|nr:glycosyltransferase [bacterium]
MRIAIFTNTYWPTVNGVAISIANLRTGLQQLGHAVHVFAPAPAGFDTARDEKGISRFPALPAPVEADYHLALPVAPRVTRALMKHSFDLVHTHHPMWVGVWGQWYARWMGLPLVTTIHTQYEIYSKLVPLPDEMVDQYLRVRVRSYCNRCDLVTTPAESSRGRLRDLGVKRPIEVIYNPTDLSALWHADGAPIRKQYGCGPDDFLLGYVGRLAPEKNLSALLDAAEIILPQMPQVRLLLVGDGPSRPALEERARAIPGGDRIMFAGRIEHERVPQYDAALDLFITPSMFEVQPLSFAEAMAAATPVIAMDAPGGNDMVEDGVNGRLVPPDEQGQGLARVAREVLSDPDGLRQMSERARDWATRYDRMTVVRRVLEVYERATELHRAHAT